MMYTMPKNLLSICVNFTLATQQPVLIACFAACEANGNCADAARAHKRTDTCGFRPLVNLPFPLDGLAQIADM